MSNEYVQTNIRLDKSLKKQLKFICLERDMTFQDLVNQIISENIDKYK